MTTAKRNHYNPCFWTALLNEDYFETVTKDIAQPLLVPREQVVHALNVKSGNIRRSKVDDLHYDKNLGVAEISRKAAEEFAKKYHPDQCDKVIVAYKDADYPVYIDFEQILTELEKLPPYKVLLQVARKGRIKSDEEKAHLGCFLVVQNMRSHAIMRLYPKFPIREKHAE